MFGARTFVVARGNRRIGSVKLGFASSRGDLDQVQDPLVAHQVRDAALREATQQRPLLNTVATNTHERVRQIRALGRRRAHTRDVRVC